MAASGNQVDVKVRYIPDTSALRTALEGTQKVDFKIGGGDVKKELLTPIQNAMREVNRALSSGADSKTLLKLFKDVGSAADVAKTKANNMLTEFNSVFNSAGNQKLLKDLENYQKELTKVEKQISSWDKKYGNKVLGQMKTDLGVGGVGEARKQTAELEEQVKAGQILTQQEQARLDLLKQYVATWNERQTATPKRELEGLASNLRFNIKDVEGQVQTGSMNVEANKELARIIALLGNNAKYASAEIGKLETSIKQEDVAATAAAKAQADIEKEAKKEASKIGDIFAGTFLGTSANSLLQSALRRGIDFFKDYDETLTRTMMVTGMTRDEVNGLTSSYNDLANQLSSTTKDVAAAQLVFYQQGLGTSEALKMTEASIAISKTGGIEAGEAANRLTAAVRGYKLAADDAMDIADKMSALDAAAASSVDELTIAMQKSASQARMAGLDLDYYMAYLSTMQEVTREAPENIGTAMKSITSRLQEITDIGKVEEDGTTFSNVAKALTSVGIAAVDSSGQLRKLQDIFNDLGPMWATLDKNHKAYLATVLAGNRQQSRFIALMDNYDRAMELVSVSQNASGESAKQLRAYNQGLEASFTRLSNAWQQFATKVADSSMIKQVVDLLSSIIETLNKLPKGLTTAITAFVALNGAMKVFNTVRNVPWGANFNKWLGIDANATKQIDGLTTSFGKFGDTVKKASSGLLNWFDGWGNNSAQLKKANQALQENTTLTNSNLGAVNAKMSQQVFEATQSAQLNRMELALSDSYDLVTDSILRNEAALGANDDEILLETNQAYAAAKGNLAWSSQNEQLLKNSIANLKDELGEKIKGLDTEYKTFTTSSKHGNILIQRYLESQGMSTKGLKINQAAFDKYYDDAAKWLKKDVKRRQKELANEAGIEASNMIDELDKAQKKSSSLRQEMSQIRKDSGMSYAREDLNNVPAPKKTDFIKIKNTLSNNSLSNIQKAKATFSELGKTINMSSVASGVMIGSMVTMGTKALGLDDDLSGAIGTFAGLGKILGGFGPMGWAAAAGIAGLKFMFDKLWPSVEDTQKKLAEIQQEQDKVNQTISDISNHLEVYETLRGKLDKTDEETQQLKDSTEALIELIPGAVVGYNQYGEAILNTAAAYEELDKKQRESSALADKSLAQFDKLQKGANRGEKIGATLTGILGVIATVAGVVTANPLLVAGGVAGIGGAGIWGAEINDKQLEENRKVWDENYSEILKNYQIKRDEFLIDVSDQNKDTASKVVDSFITSMMEAGRGGSIANVSEAIEELLGEFSGVGWSSINIAMERLSARGNIVDDMSLGDARKFLEEELKKSLENAGLDDAKIEGIITAVLNIEWDGAAEIAALKKNIDTEIANIRAGAGDAGKIPGLEQLKEDLDLLTQEEQKLLVNSGMLDTAFAGLFSRNGGIKNTLSGFRMQNGELNTQKAIITSINELLKDTETSEDKIAEYKELNTKEQEQYDEALRKAAETALKVDNIAGKNSWTDEEKQDYINRKYEYFKSVEWDKAEGQSIKNSTSATQQAYKAFEQYTSAVSSNNVQIKALEVDTNKANDEISNLVGKIKSYAVPTFNELSTQIKDLKENWDAFLGLGSHLDDTNGILDVDGITQLFDLLGSFETAAFETQEQFDAWIHAIDAINNGMSMQNGLLSLNEEAMGGVNDLISYSTRLKANDMLMTIEKGKAELENQKSVLIAQKSAVDAEIARIELMKKKEYEAAVESGDLQKNFKENYMELLNTANMYEVQGEENKLTSMIQMNNNYYKQLAAMRTAYTNGEDIGDVKWADIEGEYEQVYNKFVNDTASSFTDLISKDKNATLDSLRAYSNELGDQIRNLNDRIASDVQLKETVAKFLSSADTNLGKAFGDNSQKSVSDYNEQLERTLNLLEKIAGLQHAIDENETFKSLYEGYGGESYGRLLMSNLQLAQQQHDVYKDLFTMQQQMTNQAAGDLLDSPYGSMFKIQDNGDIGWVDLSMYNKYKNMPNDMQEDIDNLVQAFQEQRDALRDTEQELSKYAQGVKKVREELVAMEIEIENALVEAIKNRENILHNARMKALDDEIDMIDKAVEARKKARENENDNKELYQAQEALRRATLDSSGKNNASLLQLQQELEEKQLDISEKRFEQDMEDRKNWLQDTKDAETETFNYRLETMTWYWEQVQMIQEAGTEAMMLTLIQWNEEYRVQSALQQSEMEREWRETMDAMKAATDMGAELDQLTSDIVSVTHTVEAMDIQIAKLPGTWQKATDAANSYYAAVTRASSYSAGSSSGGNNTTTNNDKQTSTTVEDKYTGTMKKGDKIEFKPLGGNGTTVATFSASGTSNGSISDPRGYDRNYTAGDIKKINGVWMVDIGGGQYVPVNNFQSTGSWGKSTRYYAQGGIVDYTGPAWVDGTKTKPEAFLNPYQTEQIAALANNLDQRNISTITGDSNVTFGSISFNVASMSSAADGKKALDIFVQGANDLMAKKGISTKLNLNIK